MKQIAIAGAMLLVLSGCRAPMPSMNLLAPYGTSRVPPPGTGTIGTGGNYYSPPANSTTNPPVGTGFRPATIRKPIDDLSSLEDSAESKSGVGWSPDRDKTASARLVDLDDIDVALSKQQPVSRVVPASRVIEHRGPIRIVQPNSIAGGSQGLRGTPNSFVPSGRVVDIGDSTSRSSSQTVPAPTSSSGSRNSSSTGWRSRT